MHVDVVIIYPGTSLSAVVHSIFPVQDISVKQHSKSSTRYLVHVVILFFDETRYTCPIRAKDS